MRYEVTLDDGWKTRVNASGPAEAMAKAERYNPERKALDASPCEEINPNEYA